MPAPSDDRVAQRTPVVAAGAVVFRKGREVLLVHRPKYDDWAFPKGKLDPGEHVTTAAVREVAEETGIDIRLGPPLTPHEYEVGNGVARTKVVHYWIGRAVNGTDVSTYHPNSEIDEVTWSPLDKARDRLTYDRDRETLDEAWAVHKKSYPLVILRHGRASSRTSWRGDDRARPLTKAGEFQAEQVVPVLGAYGVRQVLSSSSKRCWTSVAPYAEVADVDLEVTPDLSEEEATPDLVTGHVQRILSAKEPAVLCTHRPVLPWVFEALGLKPVELEPGWLFVAHHRRGLVVATEEHAVGYR
jgi:8-oxo-(d)GTP phosphatase